MKTGAIAGTGLAWLVVVALVGCAPTADPGGETQPLAANKALGERFAEAWNKGHADAMDELLADDFVMHGAPPGVPAGRAGYKQFVEQHLAGFPDFQVTVNDVVAEGDKIARHVTWSGTHDGEYMGIAPTGKKVTVNVISIERIEGGKIAEQWAVGDLLGMMRQLGVAPPPGQEEP